MAALMTSNFAVRSFDLMRVLNRSNLIYRVGSQVLICRPGIAEDHCKITFLHPRAEILKNLAGL